MYIIRLIIFINSLIEFRSNDSGQVSAFAEAKEIFAQVLGVQGGLQLFDVGFSFLLLAGAKLVHGEIIPSPLSHDTRFEAHIHQHIFEIFHDTGSGRSAVDEDDPHDTVGGSESESADNVGSSSLTEGNTRTNIKFIEHLDQVLAKLSKSREFSREIRGIILLARDANVQENGLCFNVGHGGVIHEAHKGLVIRANVVDCQDDSLAVALLQVPLYVDIESGAFALDGNCLENSISKYFET